MRASKPGWVPLSLPVTVSFPHAADPRRTASRAVALRVRFLILLFMALVPFVVVRASSLGR